MHRAPRGEDKSKPHAQKSAPDRDLVGRLEVCRDLSAISCILHLGCLSRRCLTLPSNQPTMFRVRPDQGFVAPALLDAVHISLYLMLQMRLGVAGAILWYFGPPTPRAPANTARWWRQRTTPQTGGGWGAGAPLTREQGSGSGRALPHNSGRHSCCELRLRQRAAVMRPSDPRRMHNLANCVLMLEDYDASQAYGEPDIESQHCRPNVRPHEAS